MTGKTCLIVEDQLETGSFLTKIVKIAFPNVVTVLAQDLKSAISIINDPSQFKDAPLGFCIIDLGLPDGSGIDVIRELKEKKPEVLSVVATIYDDDAFLFKALAAGAFGYLLKADDESSLVNTLKLIENNNPPLSPSIARRLLQEFREDNKPHKPDVNLSPRERETLVLIGRGLTVNEAAAEMKLSAQTVAGYVKIIYQKLHVSNRVELIREATRRGLV